VLGSPKTVTSDGGEIKQNEITTLLMRRGDAVRGGNYTVFAGITCSMPSYQEGGEW